MTELQPLYLSDKDVARIFSISRNTVWKWTREGKLPQPTRFTTGCTRWNREEIEAVCEAARPNTPLSPSD